MALKAIVNGAVVTMDPERRVLDDGVILIEDHHISAVGEASDVEIPGDAEVIDGSHMAVASRAHQRPHARSTHPAARAGRKPGPQGVGLAHQRGASGDRRRTS